MEAVARRLGSPRPHHRVDQEGSRTHKAFLASTDVRLSYTERVYEGCGFDAKLSTAKYISFAIYLDGLIDKDAVLAEEASPFLVQIMDDHAGEASARRLVRAVPLDDAGVGAAHVRPLRW